MTAILMNPWDPPRHRGDQRPKIITSDGHTYYSRASGADKQLADTWTLQRYTLRKTVEGAHIAPHLLAEFVDADRRRQDEIVWELQNAGGANEASDTGTGIHALLETYNRGMWPESHWDISVPRLPTDDPHLAAWEETVARYSIQVHWTERFVVNDTYRVAGTPDLVCTLNHPVTGERLTVVGDYKTGASVGPWNGLGWCMQLAGYAHGTHYDVATGERIPIEPAPSQDVAIVFHIPAGAARCDLYEIDLRPAYEMFRIRAEVIEARKRGEKLHTLISAPVNDVASWAEVEQAVSDERRAWIRSKVKNFAATVGLHEVNRVWPEGVPKRADQLTSDDQVDAISAALDSLLVPSQESNTGGTPYLDEPADMQDVAFMQQRLDELTDSQRGRLNDIAKQAHAAGYPISVRADPTVRKLAIANALIDAVEVGLVDDDEWLHSALHAIDVPKGGGVGARIGQLTTKDANQLAVLSEQFRAGDVTATFDPDGFLTLTLNHK